jgi:hypothetical protein
MVGTSGTVNTLKPRLEKCSMMRTKAVVLPAQGPPVNTIRLMLFIVVVEIYGAKIRKILYYQFSILNYFCIFARK